MTYSTWLEIKKEALRAMPHPEIERFGLEKVQAYTGSRRNGNLFDNAVLRAANISHVLAIETDLARGALLALESDSSKASLLGPAIGSKKHPRPELAGEEVLAICKKATEIAAQLKIPGLAKAQVERSEKKSGKAAPK